MKSPFIAVAESEQAGTGLAVPLGNPADVFSAGGSTPFLHACREAIAKLKPQLDISTKEGRSFIASTAYKIARTKTAALSVAKAISGGYKVKAKEVDTEADWLASELDRLKHETRRPLTEWEDRDKERAGEMETKLGEIYDACLFVGAPTVEAIQLRIDKLMAYTAIDWAEYEARARQGFQECFPALRAMLAKAEKEAADKAELEELRKQIKGSSQPDWRKDHARWDASCPNTEAVPQKQEEAKPTSSIEYQCQIDQEALESLVAEVSTVDLDQAVDIIDAIKAGKIRHVSITY